ncbi:hypothetical protein V1291_005471 [Nitrobacteraceae bacterium AZCC 1564]
MAAQIANAIGINTKAFTTPAIDDITGAQMLCR